MSIEKFEKWWSNLPPMCFDGKTLAKQAWEASIIANEKEYPEVCLGDEADVFCNRVLSALFKLVSTGQIHVNMSFNALPMQTRRDLRKSGVEA